jgi:hypothetical protein
VPESSWLETNLVCELILLRKPGPIPLASRSISGNDDAMAAQREMRSVNARRRVTTAGRAEQSLSLAQNKV